MVAMVVIGGKTLVSALSFYACLFTAVPVLLILAPQPIRKDKRVIVALLTVAVLAVGVPTFAVVFPFCQGPLSWFQIECWLY